MSASSAARSSPISSASCWVGRAVEVAAAVARGEPAARGPVRPSTRRGDRSGRWPAATRHLRACLLSRRGARRGVPRAARGSASARRRRPTGRDPDDDRGDDERAGPCTSSPGTIRATITSATIVEAGRAAGHRDRRLADQHAQRDERHDDVDHPEQQRGLDQPAGVHREVAQAGRADQQGGRDRDERASRSGSPTAAASGEGTTGARYQA